MSLDCLFNHPREGELSALPEAFAEEVVSNVHVRAASVHITPVHHTEGGLSCSGGCH